MNISLLVGFEILKEVAYSSKYSPSTEMHVFFYYTEFDHRVEQNFNRFHTFVHLVSYTETKKAVGMAITSIHWFFLVCFFVFYCIFIIRFIDFSCLCLLFFYSFSPTRCFSSNVLALCVVSSVCLGLFCFLGSYLSHITFFGPLYLVGSTIFISYICFRCFLLFFLFIFAPC